MTDTSMAKVSFRPYHPSDLDTCAQMAADAWPVVSVLVPDGSFARLMRGYVELGRLPSTRCEVACISNRVVGLLSAQIRSEITLAHGLQTVLSCAAIGMRAGLGRYGRIARPLALLRDGIVTGARVRKHMPKAGAVIELLVVSSQHRGQGIGRALMDRFVTVARCKGARRIALHSDEMSGWGFYEKVGFRRWATFREVITSRLTGKDKQGYVYVMDLDPRPKGDA
jgi:GNAT superfamily N-acetyltransferase